MKLIYFTKFLKGMSAVEVGAAAKRLGFDGLDLAIRGGQCVNPDNVTAALPAALKQWREAGLSVPLATLEGGAIDPQQAGLERIFAACGEAGIPNLKLGYWLWKEGKHWSDCQLPYWDGVASIRRALEGFQKLGEKYGVCSLVHTHCDNYYGLNASSLMHLVRGFDERYIGAYLDPAHLSLNGEPLPMAVDIVGKHLKMVAAKSVRWIQAPGDPAVWKQDWCLLSEGVVHWPTALKTLRAAGYDGAISVHGEYSGPEHVNEILAKVEKEVAFLRSHLS